MRYPESRRVRRIAARAAEEARRQERRDAKAAARAAREQEQPPEERRKTDRRSETLTGPALDARLAELGISGDRRTRDRRQR